MLKDISDTVTKPFTEPVSIKSLLIYTALFLILAWIVCDTLRILSKWVADGFQAAV